MGRLILIAVLALSGCARYEAARECQTEYPQTAAQQAGALFGALGGVFVMSDPDVQARNNAFNACVRERAS